MTNLKSTPNSGAKIGTNHGGNIITSGNAININFNFRYPSVQRIFPNLSNKIDEFSGRVGKIKDGEEPAETMEWGGDEITKEETRETFMKRFTGLESDNLKPANEGDNLKRLSTRKSYPIGYRL